MPQPKGVLKHNGYRAVAYGGRNYARKVGNVPLPGVEMETARLRSLEERRFVWATMDRVHRLRNIICLISGCADGLDECTIEWALARGIPVARYAITRGEWKALGGFAGPQRNQRMIDEGCPDIGIEFPGGRGTADMRRRLDWKGVPVYEPCKAKEQVT